MQTHIEMKLMELYAVKELGICQYTYMLCYLAGGEKG